MASYTEKLNLLKKDPTADASDTFNIKIMMNENWDKLDANAAGVAAELAGKVNANNRTTLNLDTAITTGHWTWTDDNGVFGITGALYNIDVSSSDFSANPSIVQTATRTHPVNEAYPSITLKRTFYFTSGWTAWVQQGTATPPTEYDLPLASGFTAPYGLKYSKNQFGEVTFGGVVEGSFGATLTTFATLPAGYRPPRIMELPATGYAGKIGFMRVDANGAVSAILDGDAPYLYMLATFVAGN
ncbi:hypothetical protein [uncultured Oscillibacter sp.]|uniref:hypothetical protein n=1 Tax=uncultured Oscillibacter sp. TaxID=876091 RepID=UPI0025F59EAD|nr:hypothetical protein [uncultured Oscillibacter sp.]